MLLNEWEIWRTYATYFVDPLDNLEKMAQNLVQSKLLECAFLDNGSFFWLKDSVLTSGKAEITLSPNRSSASFNIKPSIPDKYAGESLFQSLYFRFAEMRQYQHLGFFPPKYMRGHLGECQLVSNKYNYLIYPVIKLFETGVLLVEMRIFSPETNIRVEEFVDEFVNMYKTNFDEALVPPALRIAGQHAYALSVKSNPIVTRLGSFLLDRDLRRYIDKNTVVKKHGDFEFQLIPLWGEYMEQNEDTNTDDANERANTFTIQDLASTISHAVSVSIRGLRKGASLLIKPNSPFMLGDYWTGRPHIHLLRFQGQATTTKQNETKFRNKYSWIMLGSHNRLSNLGKQRLPANARHFDDYGAYIGEQGTLWVWTKRGLLESKEWETANHGHLVYLNQSLCDLLEYGYMLHRQLLELLTIPYKLNAALRAKENLINLQSAMDTVSGYGEIRDLLNQGWQDMRMDRLQAAISDLITIRQTEASVQEGRNLSAWQILLSIVFGIVAVPEFASGVVEPLWKLLNLWQPTNASAQKIWFFLISLIIIVILMSLLINWARKKSI